jgi:hypothetical protein
VPPLIIDFLLFGKTLIIPFSDAYFKPKGGERRNRVNWGIFAESQGIRRYPIPDVNGELTGPNAHENYLFSASTFIDTLQIHDL